jgi:hypothetical protein
MLGSQHQQLLVGRIGCRCRNMMGILCCNLLVERSR